MNFLYSVVVLYFFISCSSTSTNSVSESYEQQAQRVTIIRDERGIPHIYGKTDADAVFGLMYAQCEESFELVEKNYIERLGRMSEIEGENYLYQDLKMRLLYDTTKAIQEYNASPEWLKKLVHAFSDGIHFYLQTHPEVKPALLHKFEPWYPFLFNDGAYISNKTGGLEGDDIKNFFEKKISLKKSKTHPLLEPMRGSNAFAIGPSKSASKTPLLFINPHVSFYFRTEVHMVSEEGLNAYGAATWGQFFIFQGFNENCGWMHTSSESDVADLYEEKIIMNNNTYYYEYNGEVKLLDKKEIQLKSLMNGTIQNKSFTTFRTQHGPVVGLRDNTWLTLRYSYQYKEGLIQSWQRMKSRNLQDFTEVMQMRTNNSTNTMYADNDGNIAYWHGNFIPRRNTLLNTAAPLDGSTSRTDWQGIHELNELIYSVNPSQGFLQNCNSSPFNISGYGTIDKNKFPAYMAPEGENFRSQFALKQLSAEMDFTIDKLIALGFNPYLSAFDSLLPPLFKSFDSLSSTSLYYNNVKEPIDTLKKWNRNSSVSSAATTVAIFWTYQLLSQSPPNPPDRNDQVKLISWYVRNTSAEQKINALYEVIEGLKKLYGTWKIPWGEINRFQKISTPANPKFNNELPSFPVGMGPAFLGSLASYEAVWEGNKQYGVAGNSFIAVVQFGNKNSGGNKKIIAKSVIPGGKSFDPTSKNFNDQSNLFVNGNLKDVNFYKEDVLKNTSKTYHPGKE